MNYDVRGERNASVDRCQDMVRYLAKDDLVFTAEGFLADESERFAFGEYASSQARTNFHSLGFEHPHDRADLDEATRSAAAEHLGGDYLVGVHWSNPGNSHVHLAQAGSIDETEMGADAIRAFRSAVCDRLDGEQIGAEA